MTCASGEITRFGISREKHRQFLCNSTTISLFVLIRLKKFHIPSRWSWLTPVYFDLNPLVCNSHSPTVESTCVGFRVPQLPTWLKVSLIMSKSVSFILFHILFSAQVDHVCRQHTSYRLGLAGLPDPPCSLLAANTVSLSSGAPVHVECRVLT